MPAITACKATILYSKHICQPKISPNNSSLIILIIFGNFTFPDEIDFIHDGWEREAYLYKPSCIPENVPDDFETVPLVFMIHGLGGEGIDFYNFSSLAEDSCFMVVFPSGLFNTWNAGPSMPYAMKLMIMVTLMH